MKKTSIIIIVAILAILVLAAIFLILTKIASPTPQQETQASGVSDNDVNSIGQDVNAVNDSDFSDTSLDSLG